MSGTGASLNDKIDLAPWGHAPGNYHYHCGDCSTAGRDPLHFGHKHANRCAEHALAARQNAIRLHEGNLVTEIEEQGQAELYGLLEAFGERFKQIAIIGSILGGLSYIGRCIFR